MAKELFRVYSEFHNRTYVYYEDYTTDTMPSNSYYADSNPWQWTYKDGQLLVRSDSSSSWMVELAESAAAYESYLASLVLE